MRAVVVGSLNFDIVMQVPRLIREGENLLATGLKTFAGGKGANQAVAARRLGAETNLVGAVGDDAFGAFLRGELEKSGLDLRFVKTDRECPTGCAFISILPSGNNTITVDGGANYRLKPADIEAAREAFEAADVIMTVLEIPLDAVETTLRMARKAGKLSVLDAGPARDCPPEVLALADLVSPNETELEKHSGVPVTDLDSVRRASEKLISMGVETVVPKIGSRGSMLVTSLVTSPATSRVTSRVTSITSEKKFEHFPPVEIEAVDATAAGDAFTAALGVTLAEGASLPDSIRRANFAGAFAASKLGALPSMPTREELQEFESQKRAGTS